MRFNRYPRADNTDVTPRRLAAARRAVQREKDRFALFPELVTHTTAEERIAAVNHHRTEWDQEHRQRRAANWRRARRQLGELPIIRQTGIRRYWQQFNGPGDPVYLLDMITQANRGRCYWQLLANVRRMRLMGLGVLRFKPPGEMRTPIPRLP